LLVVYAVPILAMGTWTYANWSALERSLRGPDADGFAATLKCFHLPATYAVTGELRGIAFVIVLLTLIAIPFYAVKRRPAFGVLSFLAIVWWVFMGNVLLASNV
jgi:hypothetical protein